MDVSVSAILALVRYSVQTPRAAARAILNIGAPDVARWCLLAFVATASALCTHLLFTLMPPADTPFMANAMSSPVRTAVIQGVALLITVLGVHYVGRWRGGKGSFRDALLLIGWLQFILLVLQVVQIAAFLLLPVLAEGIGLIGIVLSLYLLSQFTAELHGFQSALRVFFAVLGTVFVAAFGISLLIAMLMGAQV